MDITYLGKNAVKIAGKGLSVLVDPVGVDAKIKDEALVLTDQASSGELKEAGRILIDGPGEYEVSGAYVVGVPAKLARSESDKPEGAVYRLELDGFRVAIVGEIATKLDEAQVEALGEADVLILPVAKTSEAAEIISRLEPKYVIPVGYEKLDEFLSEMGVKPEVLPKLKLVSRELPEETTVAPLLVAA